MAKHEHETGKSGKSRKSSPAQPPPASKEPTERLPKKAYEAELFRLQGELVKVQEWMRTSGARIVIIFEGRDAAGKGGTIKRVTQYLNPASPRSRRCPSRPSARRPSGTSSATSSTCPRPGR